MLAVLPRGRHQSGRRWRRKATEASCQTEDYRTDTFPGMKDLLRTTADRAARYLASLQDRSVAPTPEALANLARLDEPFPERPTDAAQVIALLDEIGSPATMASAGGRFFGFVVGGSLPAAVAASGLAAAWDQNAGIVVLSPIAARLEQVAMRWLLDVLGLPPACGVGFVTCATQANFSGLAAARHALLARRGWNVEAQGLFGAPPITVVVGEEVHVSVLKALMLVGLGDRSEEHTSELQSPYDLVCRLLLEKKKTKRDDRR